MLRRFIVPALLLSLLAAAPALADPTPPVTVDALIDRLDALVPTIAASPETRHDYEDFVDRHGLDDTDALYDDFARVKIACESTRAGGLWGLSWTVTNREPESDAIWSTWSRLASPTSTHATARAECDELSALFAFVARRLGVDGVGLYWPEWNHTVAVWKLTGASGAAVRVVVPTSQVWLEPTESLGTTGFDPWKQKTIYTYTRVDAPGSAELPAGLASFFVAQVRVYGAASQATLQVLRNLREMRQIGLIDGDDLTSWLDRHRATTELSKVDEAAIDSFAASF